METHTPWVFCNLFICFSIKNNGNRKPFNNHFFYFSAERCLKRFGKIRNDLFIDISSFANLFQNSSDLFALLLGAVYSFIIRKKKTKIFVLQKFTLLFHKLIKFPNHILICFSRFLSRTHTIKFLMNLIN